MRSGSDRESSKRQKIDDVRHKEIARKKRVLAVLDPGDIAVVTDDMLERFKEYASATTTLCLETSLSVPASSTLQHIQQRDNWSCGFRNLQMILSAIIPHVPGNHSMFQRIPKRCPTPYIPSLLQLQQYLEGAWQEGFDPKGARHYGHQMVGRWGHNARIGAVDVANILWYLGNDATVVQFIKCLESRSLLSRFIKSYFGKQMGKEGCPFCCPKCYTSKTSVTEILETTNWPNGVTVAPACHCPILPLYLQWEGHSVTAVGYDKVGDEEFLIVFDPKKAANQMQKALGIEKSLRPVRIPLAALINKDIQLILCTLRSLFSNERYHHMQEASVVTAAQAAVDATVRAGR